MTEIIEANRFHVIKLISLYGVELLPQATFRSLFSHHSDVLEHATDDLQTSVLSGPTSITLNMSYTYTQICDWGRARQTTFFTHQQLHAQT